MKRRGNAGGSTPGTTALGRGAERTRTLWAWIVLALVLLGVPGHGAARQTPVEAGAGPGAAVLPADTVELVFEREVFGYPAFQRRNPFRALTGADAAGPRFEDLVLMGRIISSNPASSIALVGARPPGTASTQPPSQTYRLRVGDIIGNTRILEIREQLILVEVEEFGLRETRVLELRRGGPEPAAAPQPPEVAPGAPPLPTGAGDGSGDPAGDGGSDGAGDSGTGDAGAGAPETIGVNIPRNGNGGWT